MRSSSTASQATTGAAASMAQRKAASPMCNEATCDGSRRSRSQTLTFEPWWSAVVHGEYGEVVVEVGEAALVNENGLWPVPNCASTFENFPGKALLQSDAQHLRVVHDGSPRPHRPTPDPAPASGGHQLRASASAVLVRCQAPQPMAHEL